MWLLTVSMREAHTVRKLGEHNGSNRRMPGFRANGGGAQLGMGAIVVLPGVILSRSEYMTGALLVILPSASR